MGGVEYSCYPHNTKWLFFPVEENAIRSIYLSGISLPESKQKNKKKRNMGGENTGMPHFFYSQFFVNLQSGIWGIPLKAHPQWNGKASVGFVFINKAHSAI